MSDGILTANAQHEWRGAKRVEMQTGHAIPRPLQADGWAVLSFASETLAQSCDED